MKNINVILIALLVAAAAAIPIAYSMGRESATSELEDEFTNTINEIQATNDIYLQEMEERLQTAMAEWDLKHEQHARRLREAMLNTGVPLEVLNAEIVEPEPDPNTPIPQSTYEAIKKGMTYDEVLAMVGREGENSFNLVNEDGTGLKSYSWRWVSEDGEDEQLSVTFEGNLVADKHYTAFEF